jgi:hypothetical protein
VKRLLSLILVGCAIACSESFPPASAVTDLRAVAARVDVEGEPGRANPSPGESVEVSILVIDQGAPPSELPGVPALTPPLLQWAFVACIPQATLIGAPICRSPIEPCEGCIGTPPEDPLALPVLRFTVPTEQELQEAEADSVVVQGAICADGPPAEEAILRFILGETEDLSPCEDPSQEGRFVSVVIPIEADPDDPNFNPQISSVTLNGDAWPPPYDQAVPRTAPRTGCAADLEGLTDVERMAHPTAGSSASTINLLVSPDSLQPYMEGDETRIEEIQVSWFADGGGFESTFSFITDPARSVLTQWKPSSNAPADGILVRFTFVIRDGRGGADELERGLCILSPTSAESPP